MRLVKARRGPPQALTECPADRTVCPELLAQRKRRFEESQQGAKRRRTGSAMSEAPLPTGADGRRPDDPLPRFDLFEALRLSKTDLDSRRPDEYSSPPTRGEQAAQAASVVKGLLKARRDRRLAELEKIGVSANATQETMDLPMSVFGFSGGHQSHRGERRASNSRRDRDHHPADSSRSSRHGNSPSDSNPPWRRSAADATISHYCGPSLMCTPWAPYLFHECGDKDAGIRSREPRKRWRDEKQRPSDATISKTMRQLPFEERLHEEICAFAAWCEPTEGETVKRLEVLARVLLVARSLWPTCKLVTFGSFSTGLSLPQGDVDICLMDVPRSDTREACLELVAAIRKCRFTSSLTAITKARIPIVKLIDEATGIHADVSMNQGSARDTTHFIRQKLEVWPVLRPLLLVLKMLLRQSDLGETYRGGIGSYMLFTMILSHLQDLAREPDSQLSRYNLGDLLIGFFYRYCNWDRSNDAIDVRGVGCAFPKFRMRMCAPELHSERYDELLSISSPLEPTNDIGKNSFRIAEAMDKFEERLERLLSVRDTEQRKEMKSSENAEECRSLSRLREASLLSAVISIDDRAFRRRSLPRFHPSWHPSSSRGSQLQPPSPPVSIYSLRPELEIPVEIMENMFRRLGGVLERTASSAVRARIRNGRLAFQDLLPEAQYNRSMPLNNPAGKRGMSEEDAIVYASRLGLVDERTVRAGAATTSRAAERNGGGGRKRKIHPDDMADRQTIPIVQEELKLLRATGEGLEEMSLSSDGEAVAAVTASQNECQMIGSKGRILRMGGVELDDTEDDDEEGAILDLSNPNTAGNSPRNGGAENKRSSSAPAQSSKVPRGARRLTFRVNIHLLHDLISLHRQLIRWNHPILTSRRLCEGAATDGGRYSLPPGQEGLLDDLERDNITYESYINILRRYKGLADRIVAISDDEHPSSGRDGSDTSPSGSSYDPSLDRIGELFNDIPKRPSDFEELMTVYRVCCLYQSPTGGGCLSDYALLAPGWVDKDRDLMERLKRLDCPEDLYSALRPHVVPRRVVSISEDDDEQSSPPPPQPPNPPPPLPKGNRRVRTETGRPIKRNNTHHAASGGRPVNGGRKQVGASVTNHLVDSSTSNKQLKTW